MTAAGPPASGAATPGVAGPPTRAQLAAYALVRNASVAFARVFWRLSVEGLEHVPAAGPFVLAPVHRSNVDTFLVAAVTRRRLRYMGKDSLFRRRFWGWLFGALGAFPVHRGTADREALNRCVEVLRGGEPLVVYPEGTRRTGPAVADLYDGAAYLAARTGAPVVPVGIGGSDAAMPVSARLPRPGRVHLVVGPPLAAPTAEGGRAGRKAVRDLTASLAAELQRLYDAARAAAEGPASRARRTSG